MSRFFSTKYVFLAISISLGIFFVTSFSYAATGTIVDGFQQSTLMDIDLNNDGFDDVINWKPTNGTAVSVSDTTLTGTIWGETIGWINLAPTNGGVTNTTGGVLGGYAWGQNAGWINFAPTNGGVTISTLTGEFSGHAWSQNYGWIKFDCSGDDTSADADDFIDTCVKTDWSPAEDDEDPPPPPPPPLIDVCPNIPETQMNIPFGYMYQNGICVLATPPVPAICADTIDNDNDGFTDYPADLGCANAQDQSEYNQPLPPDCTGDECYPVATTCEQLGNCPPPDDTCTNGNCNPPPNEGGCVGENCGGFPPPVNETFPPGNGGGSNGIGSGSGFESNPIKEFFSTINNTFSLKGDSTAKTVSLVGILAMAFALPFTFWPALLAVFGYRRRHAWGAVYDSVTKHPLDPARVVLFDLSGNEIETSLTDIDGRFSFSVSPGTYRVVAYKEGYAFPSQRLIGKVSDEIYSNLYFGESFVINSSNENVFKNIPMDPAGILGTDRERSLGNIYASNHRVFSNIASIVFILGFIFSLIALINSPTIFNSIIVAVYCLFIVFRQTILHLAPAGGVIDRTTGQPIAGAIIHILAKGATGEGSRKVTNAHGVYHARVPNGQYTVSIDRRNADGTYQKGGGEVLVTRGSLSKVFEI